MLRVRFVLCDPKKSGHVMWSVLDALLDAFAPVDLLCITLYLQDFTYRMDSKYCSSCAPKRLQLCRTTGVWGLAPKKKIFYNVCCSSCTQKCLLSSPTKKQALPPVKILFTAPSPRGLKFVSCRHCHVTSVSDLARIYALKHVWSKERLKRRDSLCR